MTTKFPKMNPKAKRMWVKALRSGKYEQTTGQLRETLDGVTRHCCLGVLCEVEGQRYNPESSFMPATLRKRAGLEPNGCIFDAEDMLIDMNDSKRFSFKRIATWIEKNL